MIVIGENANMQVNLPKIFPTMSEYDICRVADWYVRENDTIQPDQLLLEIDAPYGLIAIPAPPEVTKPHRVVRRGPDVGGTIKLGDFLIELEPI